jgi:ornithine cyclodeaminase
MRVLTLDEIRSRIDDAAIVARMSDALIAQSRGECDTPMPMHLMIPNGEVHFKSSYRRGGKFFCIKMAANGQGMMVLCGAETGAPMAFLADAGHLTDVRTAAVSAMISRALRPTDDTIGILGSGVQARLTARFLAPRRVFLWGRNPDRAKQCADDIRAMNLDVEILSTPSGVAAKTRLIVTCTASRAPLLCADDLQPGTHITAVGADSAGKQELDPAILRRADLLLVDSIEQCMRLGELQHAPDQQHRAIEIGTYLSNPQPAANSVADLTGLGVEDLFIAETIFSK